MSAVKQFSELCNSSKEIPNVFDFLSKQADISAREIGELFLTDQFHRWKRNQAIPLTEYFGFAELDESQKVELLLEEYGYLEQRGIAPEPSEFLERQNGLAHSICDQFKEAIDGDTEQGKLSSPFLSQVNRPSSLAAPTNNPDEVNAQNFPMSIGRYKVEKFIGKGTFGHVYLAADPDLQRQVAIKVPTDQALKSAGGADAFIREARAVARLDHPHIVPVYDFGTLENGQVYVVSKYIHGSDLRQLIKNGITHQNAARVTAKIALALHDAHRKGMVHRDIKPANILIDAQSEPHLVDFGLALTEFQYEPSEALAGTPAYMSPEQARGESHRVDGRSDIYSLGVVFYELLTGKRPFRSDSPNEIFQQIKFGEVRPPRQTVDSIPRELERICLKSLSRRLSDRYNTAKDFADELEAFLSDQSDSENSTLVSTPLTANRNIETQVNPLQPIASGVDSSVDSTRSWTSSRMMIVPKGLRSFDRNDAEFFLNLVPGPRDRHGLADSLRFWKNRIEEKDVDETFSVGLLYGPSGCGKSSLVKAGLLPIINDSVQSVYVEASPEGTESRISAQLGKLYPDLAIPGSLSTVIQALRSHSLQKTLIVIDQFEQWLHAWKNDEQADLIQALRQCDGGNVQVILMVRDDYWMAATRLMREIEVAVIEGHNAAAVDLFDPRHARRVLIAYGQAFGALPQKLAELTTENEQFLDEAINGLSQDGKIISVRLALFAEMFKGREWVPASLEAVGGTQGVGVAFLDEVVGEKASRQLKVYAKRATAILKALLPEQGTDIKGNMRSISELKAATGLEDRDQDFNEVIEFLDQRLRLITPTEQESGSSNWEEFSNEEPCFQLTHDYLVPALRRWFTRNLRSSMRGRAQLRLSERATLWKEKQNSKLVPGLFEYLQFRFLTRKKDWNDSESALMRRAWQQNVVRTSLIATILIAIGFTIYQATTRFMANSLRVTLYSAEINEVPEIMQAMDRFAFWSDSYLKKDLDNGIASDPGSDQMRALLAYSRRHPEYETELRHYLKNSSPEELLVIRERFVSSTQLDEVASELWEIAEQSNHAERKHFLNAAGSLAIFANNDQRWPLIAPNVAKELVKVRPTSAPHWLQVFEPVNDQLRDSLRAIMLDDAHSEGQRSMAAEMLANFAGDDIEYLCDLLVRSNPTQFNILYPALESNQNKAKTWLANYADNQMKKSVQTIPELPKLPYQLSKRLESFQGVALERLAVCHQVPPAELDELVKMMKAQRYRLQRLREYTVDGKKHFAVCWDRSGNDFEFAIGKTKEEILRLNQLQIDKKRWPSELSISVVEGELRYHCVWQQDELFEASDFEFSFGISRSEIESSFLEQNVKGLVPRAIHCASYADRKTDFAILWAKPNSTQESRRWNARVRDCLGYLSHVEGAYIPIDFCFVRRPRAFKKEEFEMAGAWFQLDPHVEAWERHTLNHEESLSVIRAMHDKGFELAGFNGFQNLDDSDPIFGSIWSRKAELLSTLNLEARQLATSVSALCKLGDTSRLSPLLKHSENPTVRSHLIHLIGQLSAPHEPLIEILELGEDISTQRAAVLAIGELTDQIDSQLQQELTSQFQRLYEEHEDNGLRSAVRWVLIRWNQQNEIAEIDARLAGQPVQETNNWYVTPSGINMAVIDHPDPFWIGSSPMEQQRSSREARRFRSIERKFAFATVEVSKELYDEFLAANPTVPGTAKEYRTVPGGGALGGRYFDAALCCHWLSKRDGIPEDQWCFEPNESGNFDGGMKFKRDYLRRTGYRMPTEIEWEYACRAGSRATNFFGYANDLVGEYAWYAPNSQNRAWPSCLKKPNDLGCFDMLGNVTELCLDITRNYEGNWGLNPLPDLGPQNRTIRLRERRILRGSSYQHRVIFLRSANRDKQETQFNSSRTGFRIARTLQD